MTVYTHRAIERLEARIVTLEQALIETYCLIREGEADNALHALDAFLIQRLGINPEDALARQPSQETK
jgi:hypothetical protein